MPGKVKVKVVAGRNLPIMDRSNLTTDAYVEVKMGSTIYKTDVFRKSLNPAWNSEWFRFEMDDLELQDEPLQIRLMDHDTYSSNDAIGKVYLDLNPLLCNSSRGKDTTGKTISGWIPVYDTMHGIRGEVNLIVKVELFSDLNKFRQSSCGVRFFFTQSVPEGYVAHSMQGFVEELVVNDDPEYQWIDKIRTPRASNEARQTLFSKLSGEVQRKVGLKALELGGNAVIGYKQCFDLEGESGIVVRGMGTAACLTKQYESQLSPTCGDSVTMSREFGELHGCRSFSKNSRSLRRRGGPGRAPRLHRRSFRVPSSSDNSVSEVQQLMVSTTHSPEGRNLVVELTSRDVKVDESQGVAKLGPTSSFDRFKGRSSSFREDSIKKLANIKKSFTSGSPTANMKSGSCSNKNVNKENLLVTTTDASSIRTDISSDNNCSKADNKKLDSLRQEAKSSFISLSSNIPTTAAQVAPSSSTRQSPITSSSPSHRSCSTNKLLNTTVMSTGVKSFLPFCKSSVSKQLSNNSPCRQEDQNKTHLISNSNIFEEPTNLTQTDLASKMHNRTLSDTMSSSQTSSQALRRDTISPRTLSKSVNELNISTTAAVVNSSGQLYEYLGSEGCGGFESAGSNLDSNVDEDSTSDTSMRYIFERGIPSSHHHSQGGGGSRSRGGRGDVDVESDTSKDFSQKFSSGNEGCSFDNDDLSPVSERDGFLLLRKKRGSRRKDRFSKTSLVKRASANFAEKGYFLGGTEKIREEVVKFFKRKKSSDDNESCSSSLSKNASTTSTVKKCTKTKSPYRETKFFFRRRRTTSSGNNTNKNNVPGANSSNSSLVFGGKSRSFGQLFRSNSDSHSIGQTSLDSMPSVGSEPIFDPGDNDSSHNSHVEPNRSPANLYAVPTDEILSKEVGSFCIIPDLNILELAEEDELKEEGSSSSQNIYAPPSPFSTSSSVQMQCGGENRNMSSVTGVDDKDDMNIIKLDKNEVVEIIEELGYSTESPINLYISSMDALLVYDPSSKYSNDPSPQQRSRSASSSSTTATGRYHESSGNLINSFSNACQAFSSSSAKPVCSSNSSNLHCCHCLNCCSNCRRCRNQTNNDTDVQRTPPLLRTNCSCSACNNDASSFPSTSQLSGLSSFCDNTTESPLRKKVGLISSSTTNSDSFVSSRSASAMMNASGGSSNLLRLESFEDASAPITRILDDMSVASTSSYDKNKSPKLIHPIHKIIIKESAQNKTDNLSSNNKKQGPSTDLEENLGRANDNAVLMYMTASNSSAITKTKKHITNNYNTNTNFSDEEDILVVMSRNINRRISELSETEDKQINSSKIGDDAQIEGERMMIEGDDANEQDNVCKLHANTEEMMDVNDRSPIPEELLSDRATPTTQSLSSCSNASHQQGQAFVTGTASTTTTNTNSSHISNNVITNSHHSINPNNTNSHQSVIVAGTATTNQLQQGKGVVLASNMGSEMSTFPPTTNASSTTNNGGGSGISMATKNKRVVTKNSSFEEHHSSSYLLDNNVGNSSGGAAEDSVITPNSKVNLPSTPFPPHNPNYDPLHQNHHHHVNHRLQQLHQQQGYSSFSQDAPGDASGSSATDHEGIMNAAVMAACQTYNGAGIRNLKSNSKTTTFAIYPPSCSAAGVGSPCHAGSGCANASSNLPSGTGTTPVIVSSGTGPLHRRSSESDLSTPPKPTVTAPHIRNFPTTSLKGGITTTTVDQYGLMEYPFITISQFPPNFITYVGGTVTARSVKLLERISNLEEPESRDAWWNEIRMEIRAHCRAFGCTVVVGYEEHTTICDDVCILSASGTAAIAITTIGLKTVELLTVSAKHGGTASAKISAASCHGRGIEKAQSVHSKTDSSGISSASNNGVVRHMLTAPSKLRHDSDTEYDCSVVHLPNNHAALPFPVKMARCSVCRKGRVSDVILVTVDVPPGLHITGKGTLIQAQVFRPKKDCRGETSAKEVSDSLPFLEYELHRRLINKMKVKGMNAIFGLKVQICLGDKLMVASATGTAMYVTALPPPGVPIITAGNLKTDAQKVLQYQKVVQDAYDRNRLHYDLKSTPIPTNGRLSGSSGEESEEDDETDIQICGKDTYVLEVDDAEDIDIIAMLIDTQPQTVFFLNNLDYLHGYEEQHVTSQQMFTQVWRCRVSAVSIRQFTAYFERLLRSVCFKLRKMMPCVLTKLSFRVELPEPDEMQISIIGMALGMSEQAKATIMEKGSGKTDSSASVAKDDTELMFPLEDDGSNHSGKAGDGTTSTQENLMVLKDISKGSPASQLPGITVPSGAQILTGNLNVAQRQLSQQPSGPTPSGHSQSNPILSGNGSNHVLHESLRQKLTVQITPLAYIPGTKIEKYLGNLNFFFIRETTSIRENGGLSGFVHNFVAEVLAIVRAHVAALGGNAMVSYFMTELALLHNPHKNQGQCLINCGGDVVLIVNPSASAEDAHFIS